MQTYIIVTVPKIGGARDYLQFSAFLRGMCLHVRLFCGALWWPLLVRCARAARTFDDGYDQVCHRCRFILHFAVNVFLCRVASLLFVGKLMYYRFIYNNRHVHTVRRRAIHPLFHFICFLKTPQIYFKMCCGLIQVSLWLLASLILVFVWSRPAVCESVMCVVRLHL